jgi:hypothetical protein
MRSAAYANSVPKVVAHSGYRRKTLAFIIAMISLLSSFFVAGAAIASEQSHATDLVEYLLCSWEDPNDKDSVPFVKSIYQITQTEDLQYNWFSKSNVGASADDTSSNFPSLMTRKDFDAANLDIINTGNTTGKKYTPYDLYGFSGLTFTSYQGEWNWIKVYYCTSDEMGTGEDKAPEDQKVNMFYENRKRPMDTWASKDSSQDPRVRMRTTNSFGNNFSLNIANMVFWLTKSVTGLNNALVSFSLSNVVDSLGLAKPIENIMSNMFKGIFMPLMIMMFVFTAISIIHDALIKKAYRKAMTSLLQALACMAGGIFIMMYPAMFAALPNDLGLLGQYLVLNGINNTVQVSGDDFCSTAGSTGGFKSTSTAIVSNGKFNQKAITKAISDAGDSTARAVTCQYWKLFTLTPYSLGQYGTSYENLYAKGKAPNGTKELGNSNTYPGLAAVPVGNKQVINNWLIYQISTQNKSHIPSTIASPDDGQMDKPTTKYTNVGQYAAKNKLVSETNGDWYRVVDALSNYDVDSNGNKTSASENTTDYWSDWVGGNASYRIMIAFISVIAAIVGMSAPIVLGVIVAVSAIASVLLMAFAPLALTFGMWAGKGQEILRGWAGLLVQAVIRRIILGALYMIMLVLALMIMRGITSIGNYFQSLVLLVLMSWVIVKNRNFIVDKFTQVQWAQSLGGTMGQMSHKLKSMSKTSGKFVGATAGGAVLGVKAGLGTGTGSKKILSGALRGAKVAGTKQVDNSLYTNEMGRKFLQGKYSAQEAVNQTRRAQGKDDAYDVPIYTCEVCGAQITAANMQIYDGKALCQMDYDEARYGSIDGSESDTKNS